jgi:hypothetical protein
MLLGLALGQTRDFFAYFFKRSSTKQKWLPMRFRFVVNVLE